MHLARAGRENGVDAFFEKIKKRQLVTCASRFGDFEEGNGNGRRRRFEVRHDLFIADYLQNIPHRLVELTEGDDRLMGPKSQIKRDALADMLGQPPARITGAIRRLPDSSLQPVAIELEELPAFRTQVGKL